ncbi:glycosyltransferase family 39 protein [bacterium]|nr:glycosyltransferase family 39 protein [candidate division CSSED10-310 bacterium]
MQSSVPVSDRIAQMVAWTAALIALWGSAHINVRYLEQIPHVQDSVNYLFQAQLFSSGRITIDAPPNVTSFSSEHIIVQNNRWYCHYPFLVPFLFMIGLHLSAIHMVNPLIAMLTILVIFRIGRENYNALTGMWSALLLVSSPFFMVMSASFMSHPMGLFLTTTGLLFFLRVLRSGKLRHSMLTGLAIGLLFNTRPLTAFALGLSLFSFYIRNRDRLNRRIIHHLTTWIIFVLLGTGMFIVYSSQLSGKTLQFATHTIVSESKGPSQIKLINRFVNSFSAAGIARDSHSPERGIGCVKALLELYHTYALNWPGWFNLSLFMIPLIPWKRRETDRLLYWSFFIVPLFYSLYWRSAIMYGPRYIYEILAMTVLLSARGLDVCLEGCDWLHRNTVMAAWHTRRTARIATQTALYILTGALIYSNIDQYFIKDYYNLRENPPVSLVPMRLGAMRNFNGINRSIADTVKAWGLSNAVVFVQDSRWQGFGSVSSFNRPTLDTEVVYARDINDETNARVMHHFPNRSYYWTSYPRIQLHRMEFDAATGGVSKIRLRTPEEEEKLRYAAQAREELMDRQEEMIDRRNQLENGVLASGVPDPKRSSLETLSDEESPTP